MNLTTSLTLVVAALALALDGGRANVIDNLDRNVESIASEVCAPGEGEAMQIASISTIRKLSTYLSGLDGSHQLAGCAQTSKQALIDLETLLATSNQNLCADEKLVLIENFHQDYIVSKRKVPRAVSLFFMRYATELSGICMKTLIGGLKSNMAGQVTEQDYKLFTKAQAAALSADSFGSGNSVADLEGAVTFWELISSISSNDETHQLLSRLGVHSAASIKVRARAKQISQFVELQKQCREKFQPLYAGFILPSKRLSALGYSPVDESIQEDLENSRVVQLWYGILQACEAILPVQFTEDSSLESGKLVLAGDESAGEEEPVSKVGAFQPASNSMETVDRLSSIESVGAQDLVKNIKIIGEARERAIRTLISHLSKKFRKVVKSRNSDVLVSRNFVTADARPIMSQVLDVLEREENLCKEGAAFCGLVHFGRKKKDEETTPQTEWYDEDW